MPTAASTNLGIIAPNGSDLISLGDDGLRTLRTTLEAIVPRMDKGVLASRPVSTVGTPGIPRRLYIVTDDASQPNRLDYDYGTGWITLAAKAPVVTSLPAGSVGAEVYYEVAAASGGRPPVRYHMRWDVPENAWLPVNSNVPWVVEDAAPGTVSGSAYQDLGGNVISRTIADTGLYEFRLAGEASGGTVGTSGGTHTDAYIALKFGAAATVDTDAVHLFYNMYTGGISDHPGRVKTFDRTVTAGTVVKAQYKSDNGSTFSNVRLEVRPVKIG